jgi:hypothetical protein
MKQFDQEKKANVEKTTSQVDKTKTKEGKQGESNKEFYERMLQHEES